MDAEMTIDAHHPRPFLRRDWVSLDGEWDFRLDPEAASRLPHDVEFDAIITVPFAPETPASGIGPDMLDGDFVRACWYRRRLDLDEPAHDERVIVHFGGVDRVADVWVVNGDGVHHVAHHVGGYTTFSADVTAHLGPDAQLIVRAVDDPLDLEVPRGKQDWNPVPHAIWYPPTTGIWKTVWAERVPSVRLVGLEWSADIDTMSVTMRATLAGARPADLRLNVRLEARGQVLVDDTITVTDATVVRTFPVGDGGFDDRFTLVWWPASPTLIGAELTLTSDRELDRVSSYTALRSVEVSDGQLRLNGRPYPLRLVLDQGYWPDTGATPPNVEALRHDIELTKQLGFNGARKHQKVEDIRYFTLADQLGLLTWVEMPSAYKPGPSTAATLLSEWTDIVDAHRNHPSVIAWVPINESWGVPACERDPRQRALIAALRDAAAALDGTRPISANDGWETVGGDIVGIHDYDQEPAVLAQRWGDGASVDAVLTGRRPDGKTADLDQQGANGRVVILSEFGGIALATDTGGGERFGAANWGYDDAGSPDELLRRYRELWAVVHESTALAGGCWTQLTDTYQEVNGLLTMDRTPKAELAAIAAATRGLA